MDKLGNNFYKIGILGGTFDPPHIGHLHISKMSLKKFKLLPIYKLVESSGPKHKPIFKISVRLKNSKIAKGIGSSKKEAELNAASILLKNLIKK